MADVAAEPFPFPYRPGKLALVVIDMQRDFVEPGGFGASLGNDVTRLQAIVPALRRLVAVGAVLAMESEPVDPRL